MPITADWEGRGVVDVTKTKLVISLDSGARVLSRINDSNFNFAYSDTDTAAILQLDARVPTSSQNEAVRFYVRDSLSGTRSPWIALRGANFEFLPSSGSLIQTALGPAGSVGDWFRLRLVMDFTANGGSGRADAFSMNLTTGQTTFNPIPAFQNLDMGMLAAGTLASDWNALALRQDSPGFPSGFVLADNLVVVPEPSTGLLVALGIGTLACHDRRRGRRRRRRRRNDL